MQSVAHTGPFSNGSPNAAMPTVTYALPSTAASSAMRMYMPLRIWRK